MKKNILLFGMVLMLVFPLTVSACSVIPNYPIKDIDARDYQIAYLSAFCAINIIPNGEMYENITALRAVCKQIDVSTSENISLVFINKECIALQVEITFEDIATLYLRSESIGGEELLSYGTVMSENEDAEYIVFDMENNRYLFAEASVMNLYANKKTLHATLRLSSPYESDLFKNIEISIFNREEDSNFEGIIVYRMP